MRKCLRFLMAMLTIGVLVACSRSVEPVPVPEAGPYHLDGGDRLNVVVFGQEEMSGEYIVDGSGFISMPLLAQVEARGLTTNELGGEIAQQLEARGLVVRPDVSVQILQHRPVFIVGEVVNPGQFEYMPNMSVLTAIAMAGGFTYRANTDSFTITGRSEDLIVEKPAQRNTAVMPGDVIFVSQRLF